MAVSRAFEYGTFGKPAVTTKEVTAGTTQVQLSAEDAKRISLEFYNYSDTDVFISADTGVAITDKPIAAKTAVEYDQAEAVSDWYVITTAASKSIRVTEVVRA